jgi:hypothetical protein
VGKLVNATRIAPAAKALLTPFFQAMRNDPTRVQVPKKGTDLHSAIIDMLEMLKDLAHRPTHLMELVLQTPTTEGMTDASTSQGIGGVIFAPHVRPTVYRVNLLAEVLAAVAREEITINDLTTWFSRTYSQWCERSTAYSGIIALPKHGAIDSSRPSQTPPPLAGCYSSLLSGNARVSRPCRKSFTGLVPETP